MQNFFDPLKLRDARIKAGLTQGQLAQNLGMDRQSVYLWEGGKQKKYDINTVFRWANACNISIENFFSGGKTSERTKNHQDRSRTI